MILFALQWRIAGGKGAREKKEIQAGEGGREAGGLRCGQDVLICSSKEQSGRAGRAELERTPPPMQGRRGCFTVQKWKDFIWKGQREAIEIFKWAAVRVRSVLEG